MIHYHAWFNLKPGVGDLEFADHLARYLDHAVNARVTDLFFALYRDFPDAQRVLGQEKF